jgi:hypothetical protein
MLTLRKRGKCFHVRGLGATVRRNDGGNEKVKAASIVATPTFEPATIP